MAGGGDVLPSLDSSASQDGCRLDWIGGGEWFESNSGWSVLFCLVWVVFAVSKFFSGLRVGGLLFEFFFLDGDGDERIGCALYLMAREDFSIAW